MIKPVFHIEQCVRVYPKSRVLRRYTGWLGRVDTVELDEDECTLLYRVKLDAADGQGYPYYASELQRVNVC